MKKIMLSVGLTTMLSLTLFFANFDAAAQRNTINDPADIIPCYCNIGGYCTSSAGGSSCGTVVGKNGYICGAGSNSCNPKEVKK